MTIEEKREALTKYCREHTDNNCSSCAFCVDGYCVYDGRRIDENYNIAFNGEQNVQREEINHPDRYKSGKFECIDVMIDVFGTDAVKHFCILNAFKYLWRAEKKNGAEDIKKAVWYLNKYVELEGGK